MEKDLYVLNKRNPNIEKAFDIISEFFIGGYIKIKLEKENDKQIMVLNKIESIYHSTITGNLVLSHSFVTYEFNEGCEISIYRENSIVKFIEIFHLVDGVAEKAIITKVSL